MSDAPSNSEGERIAPINLDNDGYVENPPGCPVTWWPAGSTTS